MRDLKKLLDLVFSPNDTVCPSNSKWAYHSLPIGSILTGEVTLVSPNSKVQNQVVKTEELTLLAINPINGFRNDQNVYRHQSFLWEADVGSLSSQLQYRDTIGIPTSCAIFSGNKSIHFLTVLEEPVDPKTYRLLYQWALNIGTLFDQNCKNPSRSIRIPGVIRPDTSKEQKLIEIKSKVSVKDFLTWLEKYDHLKPKEREKRKSLTNEDNYENLSGWAKYQLKNGLKPTKGRNHLWHALFCDFALAGYTEEDAINILQSYYKEEHDFKEAEWLRIAKSAFETHGR